MQKTLDLLKELLDIPSPSGFEEKASERWTNYLCNIGTISRDTYGNSMIRLLPDVPHKSGSIIMLVAHIDEVGMMINYISDNGFIYISKIGGFEAAILPAQRVVIHNKNGDINGVIGRRPPHLADPEEDEDIKFHNVFVDIGAKDREDAMKQVSIGDPITFDAPCYELINNKIVGRGIDDKVGVCIVARVLENLYQNKKFSLPIVGVSTVQEENGLYGATMVAKTVKPTSAIVIDMTYATDVPDISSERYGDCKLGEGPTLSIGSVSHKKITSSLEEIAVKNRIPIQKQIAPRWTCTDADAIFTENGGVPTALVNIPNRYMHSPVEMIDLDDVENAIKLITKWCGSQ